MYIRKTYNCIEDLILNILSMDYSSNITIVCKFDSACRVLKALCDGTDLLPTHIVLESADWDGYDKEFVISTLDSEIYCEKFYRDQYIHLGDDAIFILPDCSHECIKHIQNELENCQMCEMVEFDCDFSDSDNECADITISVGDDIFKINVALSQELREIAQRELSPLVTHILDVVNF